MGLGCWTEGRWSRVGQGISATFLHTWRDDSWARATRVSVFGEKLIFQQKETILAWRSVYPAQDQPPPKCTPALPLSWEPPGAQTFKQSAV